MARDSDPLAAGHHVKRTGTFDTVIGGKELLAPYNGCGAQQIMPDHLDDVAADSAG
jgi:hypothetical protein